MTRKRDSAPDPAEEPRGRGNSRGPKVPAIDLKALEGLARINCTIEEAASFFGVTSRTLYRRLEDPVFRSAWEDGKNKGRIAIRRLQWKYAESMTGPGANVVIHLSKHSLGETEKRLVELSGRDGGPIPVLDLSRLKSLSTEELVQLESLARKLGGGVPVSMLDPDRSDPS